MAEELVGLIGGSGLGDALGAVLVAVEDVEVDTPFGRPSGPVMVGRLGKTAVAFINRHGPGHKLGPGEVPYTANIFALKKLGVRTLIAGGAVGSLQEQIAPGDLVIVEQFIDKTHRRQSTFFDGYGAVHCEMAEPTCATLRTILMKTARNEKLRAHDGGTYVCMEGPGFSSRAESLMHRAWGGDLIGMTAMPEAKLAREAQMCYALIALASDYDCWRPQKQDMQKQTLLQEIIGNLKRATDNCLALITAVLAGDNPLLRPDCACRKSLELAVWTAPEHIDAARKDELSVLFE